MQRSRNTFSAQWKDCNPKRGICSHGLNTLFCLLLCYIVPELCTATSTLKVGIYFTSSCNVTFVQNINNTISTVMTSVRNKIDHSVAVLSPKPYFFCSEQEVFTHVGNNFNKTDELVIGIASYRLHNALRIFSDVYDFPYVASDSYMIGSSGKTFSMSSSFLQTGEVMVHVLDFFQWEGVAVVASNTRYWQDLATQIFIQLNINHFNTRKKYTIETEGIIESVIRAITDSEKAVILCLHAQDQASFLSASAKAGVLTKHAYFLFSPSPPHGDTPLAPVYLSPTLTDFNLTLQDPGVFESVFVVGAELPLSAPSLPSLDPPDYSAVQGAAVSSLLLVCEALLAYLDAGGQHVSPSHVLQNMVNLSFQVDGRQMTIDADGAILYNYYVYDFEVTNATFTPRIALSATKSHSWSVRLLDAIQWPRGIPLGADQCFKQGISCKFVAAGVDTVYIIIIFVAGVGIIIIVVVVVIIFRRYWTRKELTKGPHKLLLQPSDLTFLLKKDKGKGSRMMKSTLFDKPDLVKASEPNRSTISINELSDFTETARYNGDLVHVKELHIKGFEIKSKIMTHIRSLRDLRHENLNPCVGLLVDPLKPAIVMEYCSRGSLEDVINNEDIKLDWDFKLSLLTDLVRGLRYIHSSPIRCHGNLKSRNCVIDSRWQLRITDYGMSGFLLPLKQNRTNLESRDLLWTAPECLREVSLMTRGSEKADIFSLGIIMQEVALRSTPYSSTGLAPDTIIAKVKKPPPLIRPSVSPQAAPPQYIQIMKQAWSEMPEMRPGIEDVYDQFKKITGGKKANIVDTMFHMLEKYSNDLEEIVAERTTQLEEEKKKTDQLLFRMLPSTVAESLKIGRPVKAESFEEATIYFSDIVGFTTISAMSTPMQVVDLLNDLYTMFDATIDNYDVYKVETIGDAYMVSSGLPIRNGNRHAGEISTMALDLLSQCGKFTIRHMPDVPMRLRIGLHSGPCVAGVVGLTMPRYCLFGDTVNTASRMESTGAPFRIHVSRQCKDVLDALGGYLLDYRGETELKGKGKAPTYWLVGKEGFTKELPQPPEQGEGNHGLDSVMTGSKNPDKSESLSDTKASDNEPNTVKKVSEEGVGRDPQSAKPGGQYDENLNKTLTLSDSVDEPDPLPSGKISLDSLPEGQGGIMETNESEVSVRTNVSVVSASDISFHDEKGTKETTKEVPHILAPVSEV